MTQCGPYQHLCFCDLSFPMSERRHPISRKDVWHNLCFVRILGVRICLQVADGPVSCPSGAPVLWQAGRGDSGPATARRSGSRGSAARRGHPALRAPGPRSVPPTRCSLGSDWLAFHRPRHGRSLTGRSRQCSPLIGAGVAAPPFFALLPGVGAVRSRSCPPAFTHGRHGALRCPAAAAAARRERDAWRWRGGSRRRFPGAAGERDRGHRERRGLRHPGERRGARRAAGSRGPRRGYALRGPREGRGLRGPGSPRPSGLCGRAGAAAAGPSLCPERGPLVRGWVGAVLGALRRKVSYLPAIPWRCLRRACALMRTVLISSNPGACLKEGFWKLNKSATWISVFSGGDLSLKA